MRVLLDECVPVQVARALPGHAVESITGLGWTGVANGELLARAEAAGFEVFVVADKNLRYQQNLQGRRIAIVELWTNHRPTLERHFDLIRRGVESAQPFNYVKVAPDAGVGFNE